MCVVSHLDMGMRAAVAKNNKSLTPGALASALPDQQRYHDRWQVVADGCELRRMTVAASSTYLDARSVAGPVYRQDGGIASRSRTTWA